MGLWSDLGPYLGERTCRLVMAGLTNFTHSSCFPYFASQSRLNAESKRFRTRDRAKPVQAFGANPYEPLERAIQVRNTYIAFPD